MGFTNDELKGGFMYKNVNVYENDKLVHAGKVINFIDAVSVDIPERTVGGFLFADGFEYVFGKNTEVEIINNC